VKQDNILTRAHAVLDEQEDAVKAMNAKMLFCRVATIRDKQLYENKILESEYISN
jgi:hypothetical protein